MIDFLKKNPMVAGAVIASLIGAAWLASRGASGMGQDIGKGAVDLVGGVISGASNAVVDAANDPSINPLQPFGAWLGGTIYDIFN